MVIEVDGIATEQPRESQGGAQSFVPASGQLRLNEIQGNDTDGTSCLVADQQPSTTLSLESTS